MSAFVVDTDCMDRVVRGLHMMSPKMFDPPILTATGRRYFELNIEAVRQRYGRADDMLPDGWQPTHYEYREPPEVPGVPSDVDSLKAEVAMEGAR